MGMMIHRRREAHLYPRIEEPVKVEELEVVEPVKVEEPKVEPKKEEEKKEVVYTLDEINKLPFFSLKSIAVGYGIDVKGKKGQEIKTELIKKLGL